jgi:glucose/arabinose dehydrogenase
VAYRAWRIDYGLVCIEQYKHHVRIISGVVFPFAGFDSWSMYTALKLQCITFLKEDGMRRITSLLILLIGLVFGACGAASDWPPITQHVTSPTEDAQINPTAEAADELTLEPPAQRIGAEPVTVDNLTAANFTVALEQVAEGMVHPVNLTHAGDGSGRLFVADQTGQIYVIAADGTRLEQPFLDIRTRMVTLDPGYDERGLLGLAFHPAYANNGRFFVYYSARLRGSAVGDHTNHLSEFTVSADNPDLADPDSERVILQIDNPHPTHNGGQIRFGPDGYLYIPIGDGGGPADADTGHVDDWYAENAGGNGQDTEQNLLASILCIDIDHGDPYAIPVDNPLGDEQWAWGFRNPYSMHFDTGGDHWLLVGDVGQDRWEEVNVVQAGGNYGWNVREGTHCFSTDAPDSDDVGPCPDADPDGNPLRSPVIEFRNVNRPDGVGLVVIGGTIYRGDAIPALQGMYVFGSWSRSWGVARGQLFVAQPGGLDEGLWQMYALPITDDPMGRLDAAILAFGVGEDGTLYVLTTESIGPQLRTGKVWRIVPG